jgi:predicted small lipoprotein YifL
MKTPLRLTPAIALFFALAACGNKGPLVHPQAPADEMAVPATTAVPADATMAVPMSTTPAAPTDTTLPVPASTAPAAPAETTPPPANGGG